MRWLLPTLFWYPLQCEFFALEGLSQLFGNGRSSEEFRQSDSGYSGYCPYDVRCA